MLSRRRLEHTLVFKHQYTNYIDSNLSQKILILFANITVLKTNATFYYEMPF